MRIMQWGVVGCVLGALLPFSAQAIEIINLDTVEHHVVLDVGKSSESEIVIVPNGKWHTNFSHIEVKIPDGKMPNETYTLMDRDVWAIWKGGDFVVQQHRKNQGKGR